MTRVYRVPVAGGEGVTVTEPVDAVGFPAFRVGGGDGQCHQNGDRPYGTESESH